MNARDVWAWPALAIVTVSAVDVAAEPFLDVPALRTHAMSAPHGIPATALSGFELSGSPSRGPAWALTHTASEVDVASVAVGGATSLGPALRTQLTASQWGTSFYREQRGAWSLRWRGRVSIGLLGEGRWVRVGEAVRSGWGAGALVSADIGRWRYAVLAGPLSRGGEAALFDGGLTSVTSFEAGDVALVTSLSARTDVSWRLDFEWSRNRWRLGGGIEATTGAVRGWIGRASSLLGWALEVEAIPVVGRTRTVSVWGGGW